MAYAMGANGLPTVGGLPLPLTPEQMAAAGIPPEPAPAPGGIPLPPPNPYAGLPPNAVAGPGGAPENLGAAPDDAIRLAAGSGQGPQLSRSDISRLVTPQSTDRSHVAPPSRAESLLNIGAAEHSAEGAAGLKLIPTVGEAERATAPAVDPNQEAAGEWAARHAMGGGPRRMLETGRSEKYTQYGTVPEALQQDIAARQEAVDKAQAAGFSQVASDNADALARQREVIAQQQADAQRAEAQRQLVNQRISELQARSDAEEAALSQAKPKQASEFFGGNTGASILAALAVGLGAMGQARTGGPNTGKEIIDGAINRWVNDQKQQYDAAKDKATVANNAYKNALEIFGTPEAAEAQIRLQALAAKNALAQNMADQSKNQQWLANAQLMQQDDQLKRQQLRAQSIQQAGMREIDAKMAATGGAGSGKNPYLAAAQAKAEYRTAVRTASDTTNEDLRTGIEAGKAAATGTQLASKAQAAADAAVRFREKASSFGGRAPGQGKGELEAARIDAETKYAAYLAASGGASTRNALGVAQEFFKGKGDAIRGPSADAALDAHIKTLRGNAVRAAAAHAAGVAPEPAESGEIGEPE